MCRYEHISRRHTTCINDLCMHIFKLDLPYMWKTLSEKFRGQLHNMKLLCVKSFTFMPCPQAIFYSIIYTGGFSWNHSLYLSKLFTNMVCINRDCIARCVFIIVVWGECNHSFHNCCMVLWTKQNNRCPLCQQDWVVQRFGT